MEEEGVAAEGTGGVDETTDVTAEVDEEGVGHLEIAGVHRPVTVEAETMIVIEMTIVATIALLQVVPLLDPPGGIFRDLKATGSILPHMGLMVDPMDHLPPEVVEDMVPLLQVEVTGGTEVHLVVLARLELVYLSLLILYLHKVLQQRVATVAPDLILEGPLAPQEVVMEWDHHLEKDLEVVLHPLVLLPPEERWDMDVEAPHQIWVGHPLLTRETAPGTTGARPPAVVS